MPCVVPRVFGDDLRVQGAESSNLVPVFLSFFHLPNMLALWSLVLGTL